MPNRTERRAAERAALKAQKSQTPTTPQPVAAEQTCAAAAAVSAPIEPETPAPAPSEAQINANRENAKSSTGPTTPEGKATSSQNRRTHGLLGRLTLMPQEDSVDYQLLTDDVYQEFNPQSPAEIRLAHSIVHHYWLMQRAIHLQELEIHRAEIDTKKLSLFMRYQSLHERSYYKAQKEFQNLQRQKRQDEIGSESQNRIQEAHDARVRLNHANAERLEIDTACKKVMEAPIPGHTKIGFEQLTKACSFAIAALYHETHSEAAA